MPEDADANEGESVVRREFEAYAYSSDLIPHHTIIEGYEKAIPNGGQEVLSIVKRQQMMSFIVNLATLFSNNLIPFILILPILFAISAGAMIEITVASAVPIGLFTAGSALGRVITTWRGNGGEIQARLQSPAPPPGQNQLPPESSDSHS